MNIEELKDFGVRECPSCGTNVPANNNTCPICGYAFPNANPRQKGMRIGGALLMLALILFLILFGLLR